MKSDLMAPTFVEIWAERQRTSPTPKEDQTTEVIEALKGLGIRREDIEG